jgi:uncharacterized membrane protein
MTLPSLVWGSPNWILGAAIAMGVAAVALLWSYGRAPARRSVRLAAAILKGIGFAALALSLVEPLLTGLRPRRGANAFVILADNSQSLLIRDGQGPETRGHWVRDRLAKESPWKTRLEQDFDVRRYVFDSHLRAIDDFDTLIFDGVGSSLTTSLSALARRFRGLPIAGVLVFTDGNRTDTGDLDWSQLPPIYPVVPPSRGVARDISVSQVAISQTNFESAPAVVRADVSVAGFRGESIVATITDETGKDVERQQAKAPYDDKPLSFRFQFRPENKGISFYRVRAFAASEEKGLRTTDGKPVTSEQTLANNARLVVVDQGGGPYRVLYVSGRANWEFKFLRRALDDDDQVQLVGLIRIARRQPKFDFGDPRQRSNSRLFDGFDHPDPDAAERADQPVLIRLGTLDGEELRDGFPKSADVLYRYHAVVLDDLESTFFTPDQLALLRNFVNQRGGGLLMLGGPDSFAAGKYDRTPVGDLLPVYLNPVATTLADSEYQLVLTREGWLQPWVRMRKTEEEEDKRLTEMSTFFTVNGAGGIKPGAVILSEVRDSARNTAPALVAQQFGKGRVGAILIGDLWLWGLRRADPAPEKNDLAKAWRQTLRWLVADVPGRVDISVRPKDEASSPAVDLRVLVRDAEYRPLDNAKVALKLTLPNGENLTLGAEPDGREAGSYAATYVTKQPGAYRVVASATAPDGAAVGEREAGWAAQPAADEFAHLQPDRDFLQTIAAKTHGEVVDGDRLARFVASLSSRDAPITEPWISPLWHQPWFFLLAIACLTAEWGLRRVNGLA